MAGLCPTCQVLDLSCPYRRAILAADPAADSSYQHPIFSGEIAADARRDTRIPAPAQWLGRCVFARSRAPDRLPPLAPAHCRTARPQPPGLRNSPARARATGMVRTDVLCHATRGYVSLDILTQRWWSPATTAKWHVPCSD